MRHATNQVNVLDGHKFVHLAFKVSVLSFITHPESFKTPLTCTLVVSRIHSLPLCKKDPASFDLKLRSYYCAEMDALCLTETEKSVMWD